MISEPTKLLARLVKEAIEVHQNSYDHAAADAATVASDELRAKHEEAHPGRIYYGGVDYAKFYKIELADACEQVATKAGSPALGRLVELSLHWWNDVIDWADRVLDPTATVEPTGLMCQHGNSYDICPLCQANNKKENADGI